MKQSQKDTIAIVIIFTLMYFWYKGLEIIFSLANLELRAGLAVILGIITWLVMGDKIRRFIKL